MSDRDRFHDVATQTQVGTPLETIAKEDRVYLLIQGSGAARVLELAEGVEVLLGRGKNAAVLLDDVNASREHCRVDRTEAGVRLT
ncbi:MAG: FHA domain-containing protein, partial [Myxococcales bacterium]|nr:FHA domain-containing protein [Myxococcales bacterium]